MKKFKKTIYIGIEIKVREFLSKILFAYFAIKKNYRVIIGSKDQIIRYIINKPYKGGIFLFKGGIHKKIVNQISRKIDTHIVLDQEIMPGHSNKKYNKNIPNRFHKENLKQIDFYLAANYKIFNIAKKKLNLLKGEVVLTGMPNIDLFNRKFYSMHKEKIKQIKKKFKNFILYSSNFGYINKLDENKSLEYIPWGLTNKNKIAKHIYNQKIIVENSIIEFESTASFLIDASSKTKKKIIIRPHPSESIKTWKDRFKNCKNIFISPPTDSIVPWIFSAKSLLHRGCSTSFFGYLINKPLGFININNINEYSKESYLISHKISNIKDFINFEKKKYNNNCIKRKNFYKFLGINNKITSCEIILSIIEKLKITEESNFKFENNKNIFLHYYVVLKYYFLRKILIFLTKIKILKRNINKFEQAPKIFKGININEIKYYLKTLTTKKLKFTKLSENLISIN